MLRLLKLDLLLLILRLQLIFNQMVTGKRELEMVSSFQYIIQGDIILFL